MSSLTQSPSWGIPAEGYLLQDSKPLRRGRKPQRRAAAGTSTSTHKKELSLESSMNSSFNNSFQESSSSTSPDQELDFLTKSPVGHQWRNKKHWQSNASLNQKRFEEYSGKRTNVATPQGMEREMRRRDIRNALLCAMDDIVVPDL